MGESGNITKRGDCMSHFAKFARPGYIRVDATASPQANVYVTAYTSDSDNTLVIVAVNQNASSQSVTFSLSGGSCSSYTKYETSSTNSLTNMGSVGSTNTLAANSINTYVGTVLYGDLNNNGKVDFKDFAILGQGWPTVYGVVTLADIADNWLYGT
jgi:glucuronoarabinoxylan endo-1,4-beta-xylanase